MASTHTLENFGGRYCDVVVVETDRGEVHVRFSSVHGHGPPMLSATQLDRLNTYVKELAPVSANAPN